MSSSLFHTGRSLFFSSCNALSLAIALCASFVPMRGAAYPGDHDTSFSQHVSINGPLYAVAADALGNIWIGGRFNTVNGLYYPGLALLHPDGTLNTNDFDPAVLISRNIREVHALIIDGFYNVYIGANNGIARLMYRGPFNPFGLDLPFSINASTYIREVSSMTMQMNVGNLTSLYAAGRTFYTNGNGVLIQNLIKLESTGAMDSGFVVPASLAYQGVLQVRLWEPGIIMPNGAGTDHLIIAGTQGFTGRLSTSGASPELFFDPSGYASCVAERPDTLPGCDSPVRAALVAGGFFGPAFDYNQNDTGQNLWLNCFGPSDPDYFHPISQNNYPVDQGQYMCAIEAYPGGDLLVAGAFTTLGGVYVDNFAHLLPNGQVDTAFRNTIGFYPTAMAKQPDGKILIVGHGNFTPVTGQITRRLAMDEPRSVTFPEQPGPATQTVYEGDSVTITALVDAWPMPILVWLKNGVPQTNFISSFLSLYSATVGDSGDYGLRARTFCGSTIYSESAHITVLPTPPPPLNDMFANAIAMTGASDSVTGRIRGATTESGEPDRHNITLGRSVWWRWTAPSNGVLNLSLLGSDYRASLYVFTGNDVNNLTLVTNNCLWSCGKGCYCAGLVTNTSFAITKGTTYHISVGGAPPIGGIGNIVLTLDASYIFVPVNPWVQSLAGVDPLYAAAFGGGLYVAGGSYGQIAVSPDGRNWTAVASSVPSSAWVWGIDHVGGNFIAVADQGIIVTSPDGQNWTEQISGVDVDADIGLFSLTHDPNGFVVAVGDQGTIVTSPDGVNWSAQNSGVTGYQGLYSVAHGNGLYVVVGDAGILTSPDGTNWINQTGITGLNSVTFGNGRFVAVGYNKITFSTDGANWTSAAASVPQALYWVTYGGGSFVAVGENGTIRTSSNGDIWINDNSGTINSLWGVAYCANGQFLVVGESGTILLHDALQILTPIVSGSTIQFRLSGLNGATAVIECTPSLDPAAWQPVSTNTIVNSTVTFSATLAPAASRFYRARLK